MEDHVSIDILDENGESNGMVWTVPSLDCFAGSIDESSCHDDVDLTSVVLDLVNSLDSIKESDVKDPLDSDYFDEFKESVEILSDYGFYLSDISKILEATKK